MATHVYDMPVPLHLLRQRNVVAVMHFDKAVVAVLCYVCKKASVDPVGTYVTIVPLY